MEGVSDGRSAEVVHLDNGRRGMDRNVFMTFEEFFEINMKLLQRTRLALYRSESYQHPYRRADCTEVSAWTDSGLRALSLLIGDTADEGRILGPNQFDVKREARVGFVNVHFGGADDHAIGATHYGADGSETMKIVNRELNKLLKMHAHRGVVDVAGNRAPYYFWTDGALASGKNWHGFLGTGVRKEHNKNPGYRPILE